MSGTAAGISPPGGPVPRPEDRDLQLLPSHAVGQSVEFPSDESDDVRDGSNKPKQARRCGDVIYLKGPFFESGSALWMVRSIGGTICRPVSLRLESSLLDRSGSLGC